MVKVNIKEEGERAFCGREVGFDELKAALNSLSKKKAPGIYGITAKFYQSF